MTAPDTVINQAAIGSSEKSRQIQGMVAYDQFGRAFDVEIDLNIHTMTWVGPPILKDARPPIDLPQVFIKPVVENNRIVLGKVYCDFPAYRMEQLINGRLWRQSLLDRAKKMYPNSYGEVVQNPPRDLLIETGPGPIPIELIEASIAGNKWALGIRRKDGSFYERPRWVTEDMLERVAALKNVTGWKMDGEFDALDDDLAAKYPDYDDEEEAADPTALGGKTIPVKRGPGRPRKIPIPN